MHYLQLNLEGGQLFCPAEVKSPREGPGYFQGQYLSLDFVAVLIMIHTFHALSGGIVNTEEDEENSNFFLLGAEISD